MNRMKGKKKSVDTGAAMGATNQFTAAQRIQLELSSELVEKKKQVEMLNEQAGRDKDRIQGLEDQLKAMRHDLLATKVRCDGMRTTLAKLDPSLQESRMKSHTPVSPVAISSPPTPVIICHVGNCAALWHHKGTGWTDTTF